MLVEWAENDYLGSLLEYVLLKVYVDVDCKNIVIFSLTCACISGLMLMERKCIGRLIELNIYLKANILMFSTLSTQSLVFCRNGITFGPPLPFQTLFYIDSESWRCLNLFWWTVYGSESEQVMLVCIELATVGGYLGWSLNCIMDLGCSY